MKIEIIFHNRKATLAEDFKPLVREKIKNLERLSSPFTRVEIEVFHEGAHSKGSGRGRASHRVVLNASGAGPALRTEAIGLNDFAAVDDALRKLEVQIRKNHERKSDHDHSTIRKLQREQD